MVDRLKQFSNQLEWEEPTVGPHTLCSKYDIRPNILGFFMTRSEVSSDVFEINEIMILWLL